LRGREDTVSASISTHQITDVPGELRSGPGKTFPMGKFVESLF
jgi:hypothetical protein